MQPGTALLRLGGAGLPPRGARQPIKQHRFRAARIPPCNRCLRFFPPTKVLHPITPRLPSPHCPSLHGHSSRQTLLATLAELQDTETEVRRFLPAATNRLLCGRFCQHSLVIKSRSQTALCPYTELRGYDTCSQSVVPLQLLTFFPQPSNLQVSFGEGMAENLARAFLQVADLQNTDSPMFLAR